MSMVQSRRRFLTMTALAGAAGTLPPRRAAAEPMLETTTVRLGRLPVIYFAPQYVCEALLRADGFTDVRYVLPSANRFTGLAAGSSTKVRSFFGLSPT
jgi:NitT/TauT family transport system substrate-binding protein